MNHRLQLFLFPASLLAFLMWAPVSWGQTKPDEGDKEPAILSPVSDKKDLYHAAADAKKEIAAALKSSAHDHKRVLLVFGGNWCYDCHVLDRALHEGAAGKIMKESYVLVHVDIGEADKNLDLVEQYEIPLDKGVPAVSVLSSDGKLLYSSGNAEFEAARTMMRKDLVAFLEHWKATKVE
jgi:thiol:disulfide interchange protein